MKLNYRGIQYNYQPPTVETTEAEVAGTYRGLDWRFRHLKKAPVLSPTKNLTYRGVSYHQGETLTHTAKETQATANLPTLSTEEKARSLMFNRTQTIKKRQQVMLSRTASSLGLVINDYWNHIQGKVHPSFRHDYDRLGATMS
jgi:hypothetical protein